MLTGNWSSYQGVHASIESIFFFNDIGQNLPQEGEERIEAEKIYKCWRGQTYGEKSNGHICNEFEEVLDDVWIA